MYETTLNEMQPILRAPWGPRPRCRPSSRRPGVRFLPHKDNRGGWLLVCICVSVLAGYVMHRLGIVP